MFDHNFPFDPTYGYDEAALRGVDTPPAPADFDDFWRATHAEALTVPTNPTRRELPCSRRGYQLFEVEYDAWGDCRIGGWLLVPQDTPIRCGFVCGHGYGGREAPDLWLPRDDAAALFPCARGFHRSARSDLPCTAAQHVVHGIESRETYLHRGCATDLWAAVTVLTELVPEVGQTLFYVGGSFGGGMGAMMLPWDPRFQRGYLGVPSFGHHPIRLDCPCVGSGEAVRSYERQHPELREVLAYYDTAIHATRITIPLLVMCARFDPAVPPPGQFAVYNALPGEKELVIQSAGHFEYPGAVAEGRALAARQRTWFAA